MALSAGAVASYRSLAFNKLGRFDGTVQRIRQLGPGGFRALLWHQGEGDSRQSEGHEISGAEYRRMMERLIRAAGRLPIERDTLYHPVDRSKMPLLPPPTRTDLVSLTLNV